MTVTNWVAQNEPVGCKRRVMNGFENERLCYLEKREQEEEKMQFCIICRELMKGAKEVRLTGL
jgi:hypothetical protein